MQSIWALLVFNLVLSTARIIKDDSTKAIIELTELGYEDACYETAEAEWSFVNAPSNETVSTWEKKFLAYADFKKGQKGEVQNITHLNLSDPSLKHKYEVIEKPGDSLANETDLEKFVQFVGTASLLKATAVVTEKTKNYTSSGVQHALSHNIDLETKKSLWTNWHERFTPLLENISASFDTLESAAEKNGAESVTEYWEMLSGYKDGYDKARDEWNKIADLHKKIVNFAKITLSQKYGINITDAIPTYLLGSLEANDWTSISADVSTYPDLIHNIQKNLWKKKLIGKSLYKTASSMGATLLNQMPQADFWDTSEFNHECPAKLINFCTDGKTRISTCYEPTLSNFLSAHKNVGKVLFHQMSAEATPVLNTANRYSGLEEGISELFGILSASPAWLNSTQLLDSKIDNQQRSIVSLTITALNVLPRLAYYMAADSWRINAIETNMKNTTELVSSWWKYRHEFEGINDDANLPTFLNDEYIIRNKPYLSKFAGTLLAFQLYEYLIGDTEVRYERIVDKQINANFIKMILHGAADDWMEILEKNVRIDDVSAQSLTSFFSLLEDHIDELEEDFTVEFDTVGEKELEKIEEKIIEEINTPITTTTVPSTTETVTRRRMKSTVTPPKGNSNPTVNETSMIKDSLESKSSIHVQDDQPMENNLAKPETTANVPLDGSFANNVVKEEEEDNTPKINTSKAVWAVGAVLVATIIICVIAIFGRQRCRKTPKNRRYV